MWTAHHWGRELISEKWKTSSVDAAFRLSQDSVFVIKVLLGQGQGWARKCWNLHERLSPSGPGIQPLPISSRFPPPVPSLPEKAQAKAVCACELGRHCIQGYFLVLISVQTSLPLLTLLAILSFMEISLLGFCDPASGPLHWVARLLYNTMAWRMKPRG